MTGMKDDMTGNMADDMTDDMKYNMTEGMMYNMTDDATDDMTGDGYRQENTARSDNGLPVHTVCSDNGLPVSTVEVTSGTRVYIADIGGMASHTTLYDTLYACVSGRRRRMTDRLLRYEDRCRSLAAEYLLMLACRDFKVDYGTAVIQCMDKGKPYFTDIPLYFNLSHAGERAMCIMSVHECGCDVEQETSYRAEIAGQFFSDTEVLRLERCGSQKEQAEKFCRLWTLKESYLKCTGAGISEDGLKCDLEGNAINDGLKCDKEGRGVDAVLKRDAEGNDINDRSRLWTYNPHDGYHYAWCVATK